jgi:hypothetical protein
VSAESGEDAVVDARLRVRGVENLRVADVDHADAAGRQHEEKASDLILAG